ncbi:hypothetical protein HHK36_020834 [Tetracentron sinense]|uniref:Two-component response regulator n=1 Tax=Tetracentron sinense TaxID=13715 RepID=A0A834YW34_TETSI|nr:hypothetical protein HHK36_020834 [Tetracentron sinense]
MLVIDMAAELENVKILSTELARKFRPWIVISVDFFEPQYELKRSVFQDMNLDNQERWISQQSGVSDQFPVVSIRVLVVDDDRTCLMILDKMLRICHYKVTKCQQAEVALSMLRENKGGFDIVISDIHMPNMDGFELLKHIGLEMDLPVILMSVDEGQALKSVTHGACDYLTKPIRIESIKKIWQHVVRKRRNELKDLKKLGSVEDGDLHRKPSEVEYASLANEGNSRHSKKRKDEEDEGEERNDTSTLKKPRVVWSAELHQQFVTAVNRLGLDKAVPKKILEFMNVPGLTRENVASHLQKYRLYIRRPSGVSQNQSGLSTPFMDPQEANYGVMASLGRLDLQATYVQGQVLPRSLMTPQAGGFGRLTTNSGIGMPFTDQRNLFSSQILKLRSGEEQQLRNSSNQMNLLQGLPTNMEPKQLSHLHQSVQSFRSLGLQVSHGASDLPSSSMSLRTSSSAHVDSIYENQSSSLRMQMAQSRLKGQILNGITGDHASGLPSVNPVLGKNGTIINGATYIPISQDSEMINFPMAHVLEFPRNGFPLEGTQEVSTLTSTGVFQAGENSEMKGWRGFAPNYDILNEFCQGKPQELELQNVGLTVEMFQNSNSEQGNLDFLPSVLGHQGFTSSEKNGQNKNTSDVCKAVVSLMEGNEHMNAENITQCYNHLLVDNSFRVKDECLPDRSGKTVILAEHFGGDDLMSALFKQVSFSSLPWLQFFLPKLYLWIMIFGG